VWTRREVLTAALGAAATALLPVTDVDRSGEEWIAEALALDRQAGELGPECTHATCCGFLSHLDAAFDRDADRQPLDIAAAVVGAVLVRVARWTGEDPSGHLRTAMVHAKAARDGPARARVLIEEAAVVGRPAWAFLSPCPQQVELARVALRHVGASSSAAGLRSTIRLQLAYGYAVEGERRDALREVEAALHEGERAGVDCSAVVGPVLARCDRHDEAQQLLSCALSAPPVLRASVLTNLALSLAQCGDMDAAATHLGEAAHLTHAVEAPGRWEAVHHVRALLPPGRHRDQLDDVLR
jgi:hypothetical protein